MFGKNIRDELYKECPPKKYTNSMLSTILDSSVIRRNFHIKSRPNYTTEKGGNEWILLHNSLGTGVYIVWCYVHPSFSRKMQNARKLRKPHKKKVMLLSMILISTLLIKRNIMELLLTTENIRI